MLSDGAYEQLAKMYNAIEAGMPWPTQLTQARAAFLPKEGAVYDEILGYRVLTILPVPYRRWATARLGDLEPWIKERQTDEMFMVDASGAEDAWWKTGLRLDSAEEND